MAEQALTEPITNTPAVDPAVKAEIDQHMAASLKDYVPENLLPAAARTAVTTTDTPAAAAPPAQNDPFGLFKEKFGYDSPEAAVQDIEALRAFRAAPPVAELKFENEQSKLIAELLQAGKLSDVHAILDQQIQIDRLTTGDMTPEAAANVIKLGMQLKYKDLKPEEINYKFNKTYGLPPKPGLLPTEDQEEYDERVRAWEAQVADKQMELMIDAKLARPDLVTAKSKLVFPTIARPDNAEFLEWQKTNQENDRLSAEATQAYKAFTPKTIETKINFKDEPNKIDFDFIDEPDAQSFKVTQDKVSDINELWNLFIRPDGTPDREGFMRFVHRGLNFDKMVLNAMNQAKNATIKAFLPDNSNGGIVRQLPQPLSQEQDWLRANMEASLRPWVKS